MEDSPISGSSQDAPITLRSPNSRRTPIITTEVVTEDYGKDKRVSVKLTVDGVDCGSRIVMSGPSAWVNAYLMGEFPLKEAARHLSIFQRHP